MGVRVFSTYIRVRVSIRVRVRESDLFPHTTHARRAGPSGMRFNGTRLLYSTHARKAGPSCMRFNGVGKDMVESEGVVKRNSPHVNSPQSEMAPT